MPEEKTAFIHTAKQIIAEGSFHKKFSAAKEAYTQKFNTAVTAFSDLPLARNRAAHIRWKTIESLDKYLIAFEANVIKNKGKVLWAVDVKQALDELHSVLQKHKQLPVNNQSGLSGRELELQEWLQKNNVTLTPSTWLKEIENKSVPAHFSNLYLSIADTEIKDALQKDFPHLNVNEALQECDKSETVNFLPEHIAISEATFICADNGIVILTHESKALFAQCAAKVHIVIASIDKVIPSINDAELFLSLTSTYKNGQSSFPAFTIINSGKKENEVDGPEEFYVLLLDNGRSHVIAQEHQRQAMQCIQCGACQYACPVYETIGSLPFANVYGGPIASVVVPHLQNFEAQMHLATSSILCGAYDEVCPVNIDFKKGILNNRSQVVKRNLHSSNDKWFFYLWKKTMLKRDFINVKGINPRKRIIETLFLRSQNNLRELPVVATKTFNELWRERTGQR